MSNIIEKQDNHIGVNGLMHEFHIFPEYIKAQMPDVEPQEWTYKAFEDFIDIQWNYGDYPNFSRAEVAAPDGEEFIGFAKDHVVYQNMVWDIADVNTLIDLILKQ